MWLRGTDGLPARRRLRALRRRLGRAHAFEGQPVAAGFSAQYLMPEPPSRFMPLTDPPTVPTRDMPLDGDELVIGAHRGSEAKAYPASYLRTHHIVNDRLAEQPFVVCF